MDLMIAYNKNLAAYLYKQELILYQHHWLYLNLDTFCQVVHQLKSM